MKIIGYARVSTEEQAREGISLDCQQHKIKAYCALYGHELVEMIVDAGQSAKNVQRDGMQRLIGLTGKKNRIEGIVIYKLDRLFRNVEEALYYTRQWDKKGVALHSVNEQLDTRSAMGKFFFTIMASIAELERNVIGERTAEALRHKKAKGEKTGGDVPFGYDAKIRNGVKVLTTNKKEQQTLRLARTLREQNMTLRGIADTLQAAKVRTKQGFTTWTPMQVSRLLKDSDNTSNDVLRRTTTDTSHTLVSTLNQHGVC